MELHATIHREDDGSYWSEVRELPGCFASGFTLDEVQDGLVEAIGLCLEADSKAQLVNVRIDELKLVSG